MKAVPSQYSHTKEAEGRQEEGPEYEASKHTLSDSLPPARRYLLTVPQPSQIATQLGTRTKCSNI